MTELPVRKPNRLAHFDYTRSGIYFITICVADEKYVLTRLFAQDDIYRPYRSELTGLGDAVYTSINAIHSHYDAVTCEKYVIMPDHLHLLLRIEQAGGRMISVPTVVGSLKRSVTCKLRIAIWQKGFYDHVIRNEHDYLEHYQYIENNPVKWLIKHSDDQS